MDWIKQSYLELNNLKQKIERNKALAVNILVLSEKVSNNEFKLKFSAYGKSIQIILETITDQEVVILMDNTIIGASYGLTHTATVNTYQGEHNLAIRFTNSYSDMVKVSVLGDNITRTELYSYASYDEVNDRVLVKDCTDKLWNFNRLDTYPVLQQDISYDGYCSIYYNLSGSSVPVIAYIDNGSLLLDDNSIVVEIDQDVSSVILSHSLDDSYYYSIYYVKDNELLRITKDASGYSTPYSIYDNANLIVGCGDKVLFVRDTKYKWQAISESIVSDELVSNIVTLNADYVPAAKIDGEFVCYFIRSKGKYVNNVSNTPLATSDVLAFIEGSVVMMWNEHIKVINEEDI